MSKKKNTEINIDKKETIKENKIAIKKSENNLTVNYPHKKKLILRRDLYKKRNKNNHKVSTNNKEKEFKSDSEKIMSINNQNIDRKETSFPYINETI